MSIRLMRFPLQLSLVGLVGLAQAAPLTFNAALDQAESGAPALAAQRAQINAAQSAAIPAVPCRIPSCSSASTITPCLAWMPGT
ncbi:hypothetical protein [Aquitalea pelogenes]|uniref:hypothetical protein n=1 Tax=Aquitalea pelogenes TaxID=1293573 RepID=UPI00195BE23A|nr:hypothetical protein [Aquitalea pelogenes]